MIRNDLQWRNTHAKIESLEAHYREREQDPPSFTRELSLQSLRRTINELTEEIVRYRAHHNDRAQSTERTG
ncbi:MAG: hypothetical protein WED34_07175 [Planctomycetales bacterium]